MAFKAFPSAIDFRHPADIDYSPEPDLFHDFVGHMPYYFDKEYAKLVQEFSEISLGLNEEDFLQMIFLFDWATEYGTCLEDGQYKAAGSVFASDAHQLLNYENSNCEFREWAVENFEGDTRKPDKVFMVHMYGDSATDLMKRAIEEAKKYKRPFETFFDEDKGEYVIDRKFVMRKNNEDY